MEKQYTIKNLHDSLLAKEISSEEITKKYLEKIKSESDLNAFITVTEKTALEQAQKADKKIKQGEEISILEGIPCAIKDNIMIKDILCTNGSKILENYVAPYDATVIEKMQGSVFLGKTNMDEFAMGSSTETSFFGPTKNPNDKTKVPGGSSGGSACAVASDQAVFALGSDTGGSVRQPAALCGIVGLKPTYGRVSRYGLSAMASSFDQISWFTKTVEDSAILLKELEGSDPKDATSVNFELKDYLSEIKKDLKGIKIGVAQEFFIEGMDVAVKQKVLKAIDDLKNMGAEIIDVSLPLVKYALAVYYILMPCEVSSNLARLDGVKYGFKADGKNLLENYLNTRAQGFGAEVKRRIMLGSFALSSGYYDAYYLKAQKVRAKILAEFQEVFGKVDCLATPTTPTVAFNLGEKTNDPLTMYLEDIYTVPVNVAGLPGISIPCGFSNDLPVGLQLISNQFCEHTILRVANNYEKNNT